MVTTQSAMLRTWHENRQSYLLRLWQPHAEAPWCIQLRSIDGANELLFDSLESLTQFLATGMESPPAAT